MFRNKSNFIPICHSREACPRPDRGTGRQSFQMVKLPGFPPEPVLEGTCRGWKWQTFYEFVNRYVKKDVGFVWARSYYL